MLPPQPTRFIGREQELAALSIYLATPDARLITIVGPGGIGKTRLALSAAGDHEAHFPDGIFFISLAALSGSAQIPTAIAETLDLRRGGDGLHQPLLCQLADHLRAKRLLLVLDNIEQLLDGVELLSELLAQTDRLKLLVTSREVLNLPEEWLFPIEGLSIPTSDEARAVASADAVQLFAERARRVRPGFDLAAEAPSVARICRLVGGMPLAIELAASRTRSLSCAAIAEEIARGMAFLETSLRTVHERHRSLRAVFDSSWALLSDDERAAFMRLSIFRGSFTHAAAAQVAGATLPLLSALVDKSLVRCEQGGRYRIHELLRQYAACHLQTDRAALAAVEAAYACYYLDWLSEQEALLISGGQVAASEAISAELDELRIIWQRTLAVGELEAVATITRVLALYHEFRGRYQEIIPLQEAAITVLRAAAPHVRRDALLAWLLTYQGWSLMRVGMLTRTREAFAESLELHTHHGLAAEPGQATDPLIGLGVLALIDGDYGEAARRGAVAYERSIEQGHRTNPAYALYVLTNAARAQGQHASARSYAQQAYAAAEAAGDQWFIAYCRNELGNCARALGDYDEAAQHYRASYALREQFHDREGMALALTLLGKVALLRGAHSEARQHYQQSIAHYREIGDRGGLAGALNGLALAECAAGNLLAAHVALDEALTLARAIAFTSLLPVIGTNVAELLLLADRPAQAAALLNAILPHPASDGEVRERARLLLARCGYVQQSGNAGAAQDLAALLQQTLYDLANQLRGLHGSRPDPQSPIPEPLTQRERDVLQLIASGLSNQDIAKELILSVGTVKWYTGQIYSKLAVQTRTQAVAHAHRAGLLAS